MPGRYGWDGGYGTSWASDPKEELVAILTKADEEKDVRWASYYALLDIDGRAPRPRPLPVNDFDPTGDVDPEIISRYGSDD